MGENEKEFKLADNCIPGLEEGKYIAEGIQTVTLPQKDTFSVKKDFYVAVNTETMAVDEVFSVYPAFEQQGDFAGVLPFIVLKNKTYPWIKRWMEDINGHRVPWTALIVVSEDEGSRETDVKYKTLKGLKERNVFFPYKEKTATCCRDDDNIHILTIPKETYYSIMPDAEDLPWLAHSKFVDLSAAEDSIAKQDGWFSTVIANRFIPSSEDKTMKSTVHLVSVDGYLNAKIPDECDFVRFISIYHWNVYSEKTEDKSFVSLVNGLAKHSGTVKDKELKPHALRTGEKTFSFYHGPLLPYHSERYDEINGEEKFTADGRMIYDSENGIFDVSYSAAFNLGRLLTLSRRSEAENIAAWRKELAVREHLKRQKAAIGISVSDLQELCGFLSEGKL
ncbi:Uncharacterised protein [uncultured Roseburia sp.]|uniref:Uncharacterized protein n=1 Tax=Brotonthovivens ammoniilytica TaxID=2981725 RepID=A0ABT2TGB5_9FIRM|nr:hypothetical protein [Brotonthovivens ammoniilytica]MCU6761187.1 hypothetical protein [Brotonthovivens ammoniilytica]SCI21393.1 Uncharacterised protein [uncultured Roseburia sp.]